MTDDAALSMGVMYCPGAFDSQTVTLARQITSDHRFYKTYIRYILSTVAELTQLVHFRARLLYDMNEVLTKLKQESTNEIRWCTLSLITDRYFGEKAHAYMWSDEEENDLKSRWFAVLAPAFLSDWSNRRVDIADLKAWRDDFLAMHQRDFGPYAACELCTSRCTYNYDVKALIDDDIFGDFQQAMKLRGTTTKEGAAWYCQQASEKFVSGNIKDLSFCLAANLVNRMKLLPEAQEDFLRTVRGHLEDKTFNLGDGKAEPAATGGETTTETKGSENVSVRAQVFEVIVRQALAGAPWVEICGAVMRMHNIKVEEVEAEVERRKKLMEK